MEHNVYTEGKHLVAGVITEVYNTTYGNMKITDEFGNILTIYGTYSADGANRYDAMENAPVAGDYVVIYGIVGQYNGTPQIKNGWIMSTTKPTSVKDAIDTGAAQEHNTYTADKHIVTGVITEVYNTQYGNMKITDEAGNILTIYGTYDATGTIRYDAMTNAPVAGDTVTIYGSLGQYNGTAQIKNGWIVKIVKGTETPECTEHVDADGDEKCDVCGADVPAVQPPVTEGTTVTGVIADIAKANGWENSKAYASINLNADIIVSATGTAVGNYGLNTGKYYTNGNNWRIYQAEKPELTITAADGKTIVSVKITYDSQNTGTLTLNGKAIASGTVVTVNASSITFSVGNTGSATNGQARITAIEVVYAGGNDTPVEPPVEPECKHTNTVVEGATEATCDKAGFTGNTVCADCKEVIANGEEIPATGKHTFEEGKCTVCGAEDPNYTPDVPAAEWTLVTELKDGDLVLIGAASYGKLLSATKTGFYNVGIDYSADNFANVTDAEIFVVTVNDDGSYTFTSLTGDVIALADSYSSLNADGAHKSWTLKANGDGTFLVYNTGRKTYLEWYASKNNWSTYTAGNTAEYYLSFYVKGTPSGDTPVEPECKHTNTVVEGATEATCDKAGFTGNTICADCKEVITKGEEISATGKHTFEEGKCIVCGAEDPDYVKPDAPVAGGSADFNTITTTQASGGDSGYKNSYTTTNGWVTVNSAIQVGGPKDSNPAFIVVGPDNTYKAVCLNGKTTAVGTLTSPTLTGGISKLTINFTKMFTDTDLSVTVTITDANGNKYTHVIEKLSLDKNEKYVVYTDVWTLDTPITGDFTIEIVNNCPSKNSSSNKDRFTILDLSWEGAAEVHTHAYVATSTATCTAAGVTTYTCECGDTYTEETAALGHIDENLDVECDREGCTSKVAPKADSVLSNFTANCLGSKLSTDAKYYVIGTIVEVLDAKNGIFLIDDGTGEKFYFRLPKNADDISHANWEIKLTLGDKVQVYGKINKYNTSSAPNGQYWPAIQGGTVTLLEQHPHDFTFSPATCSAPAYCACGQSFGEALGCADNTGDDLCDDCGKNVKFGYEYVEIRTDNGSGVHDATALTYTWETANFGVQVAKAAGGNLYVTAKDHMRLYKGNTLTLTNKNGLNIKMIIVHLTNATQVTNFEKFLTGYTYTTDAENFTITIEVENFETLTLTNPSSNGSTTQVKGIEFGYEK